MIRINRPTCPNPTALATNYKHPDNKQALVDASFGKCMYCESKVKHIDFGDVEHIRPKSKYPHLEFEWSNLGFACAQCDVAKSDKHDETTPYINPYEEEPEDFFIALGALLMQKLGNERGELTIKDIRLNRVELLEKRQTTIESMGKTIDRCMRTTSESLKKTALEVLILEYAKDKEYSFFIKTLFQLHGLI